MKEIIKGSIVNYEDAWYRVSAIIGKTVNLAGIFGDGIYFKRVPISEVKEDEDSWIKHWQESYESD